MRRLRKLVLVTAPVLIGSVCIAMFAIEIWVRWRWDERRGVPGFYISDPELGQRLAPNYDGWFSGVPVHINSLGFRDTREYALDKQPGTFRILVLGDSVTFGHGALSDTTYPYLLEKRLKAWRPDVNWEVWNLGVPGYNTAIELKYLQRVGPRYQPDLVVVGFYENDLSDNDVATEATLGRRITSAVQGSMQRWLYSYELYKRILLTIRWQFSDHEPLRARLEATEAEETARPNVQSDDPALRLGDTERFTEPHACFEEDRNPHRDRLASHLGDDTPTMVKWREAVAELQRLHRQGVYRIAFFINMAPNECPGVDRFYDGGAVADQDALIDMLGKGTPAGGTVGAFLPYRPSQMPGARGHSAGNANRVKAEALFEFLVSAGLVPTVGVPTAPR
ncbi:MAG: hypothetical protein FJW22_12910 [Acidimicrobiia bacterium]|nr:hypothetical protein [Acidimicrobiia bacterium]